MASDPDPGEVSFAVGDAEAGERVDVVATRRLGVPRAAVQRALREGELLVDGKVARPSLRLSGGETVSGRASSPASSSPAAEELPLVVRYSDDRLLVVSKPAGLVVHPAGGHRAGTLVNALLGLGGPLARSGTARPGIVHRLDKDTSGLLLVAKDDPAHAFLSEELKRKRIHRSYVALVRGRLASRSGSIEAPIGRHPVRRRHMAVVPEGRPAVTHYRVLAGDDRLTLVDVALETGRTHQIRVHLAHLGHPVVGDPVYGGVSELARSLGLDRPFLHARRLEFPHPDDGRLVDVRDPLPPELAAALKASALVLPSEAEDL